MEFTLEDANKLAALLRAAPAKDPNKRRMDKQAIVKHVVDEISALQERGYTLEEVTELLSTGGLKLTLPTLKSYLQRTRKASVKGAAKAPRRSTTTAARDSARPDKPRATKAVPSPSRVGDADPASSAPKSTRSEFIVTDRERL
ncbi:MAG: hypothetical protein ABJA82_09650 [Myxococcales bacterium]